MKRSLLFFLPVVMALLSITPAQAQKPAVYFGLGLAAVRGETTDEPLLEEEYGLNYSLKYMLPFANENWTATFEADYTRMQLHRDMGSEPMFHNLMSQSYLGVGLRYYFSRQLKKYNLYQGQILPFAGISAGGVYQVNQIFKPDPPAFTAFKKEPEESGYEFVDGASYEFSAQVEGGVVYVLTPQWSIEVSGSARPGFSDGWDGIIGTSGARDWLVRGGVGVQYRF